MNSRKIVFALTILALMFMATIFVSTPKALAQARILIDPPIIDDVSILPGAQVKYNASAADVSNVYTWQVQLTYDPTILNCTGAGVAPGSLFNFEIDVTAVIDNSAGTVTLGSTQLMSPPVSGSGVMAMFNFTVLGRGYSNVSYSRPLGADTYLLDDLGHDIPVTVEDSSFNNYVPPPPAEVFIEPSSIVNPSLTPGSSFEVNISIASATDLHRWTADVFYNNTILNATAAVEGGFLLTAGTTTFTPTIDNSYNATHGQVHMTGALVSGTMSGSGDLAKVTFKALALGGTPIAVSDVDLRDLSDVVLPFTTADGFFSNVGISDVAVTSISVPNWVIAGGWTLSVTVRVTNNGDFPETFNVTVFADTTIVAPAQTVESLPPDGEVELQFFWDTEAFDFGSYALKAVADLLPGETNTENNTLAYGTIAVIFPGDLTGVTPGSPPDGKVDMHDIRAIAAAFNSHPSSSRWNPYADQDADGRVDIVDVGIACINFMNTLPT